MTRAVAELELVPRSSKSQSTLHLEFPESGGQQFGHECARNKVKENGFRAGSLGGTESNT